MQIRQSYHVASRLSTEINLIAMLTTGYLSYLMSVVTESYISSRYRQVDRGRRATRVDLHRRSLKVDERPGSTRFLLADRSVVDPGTYRSGDHKAFGT